MNWITGFLTSSIGKKWIMSLTGLFLIVFLVVHLLGNLQLLKDDGGESFNTYAHFMATNLFIQIVSKGLYFFILLHAFLGLSLWFKNRSAKGKKYAVSHSQNTSWASKNMALLGTLLLAFIFIHMGDFWVKMKFDDTVALKDYGHGQVKDLYGLVAVSFKELWIVIVYVVGLIALAFHLIHGFESAFQTLGINHSKYTPILKKLGLIIGILLPAAFAYITVCYYLCK